MLVFGFAVAAFAQNCAAATVAQPVEVKKEPAVKRPPEKKVEKKTEKMVTVAGKVVSADAVANTVVVSSMKNKKEVDETVVVDAKTKIKKAQKEIAISDIAAGDKVIARCVVVDGKNVAKSITVKVPAMKKVEVRKPEKKAEPVKK